MTHPRSAALCVASAAGGIVLLAALAAVCQTPTAGGKAGTPTSRPTTTSAPAADPGPITYGRGRLLATLANRGIRESSGLACGRRNPGIFWTHNDSGDRPRFYATDSAGRHRGTFNLSGATAGDWEDMASVVLDKKSYLLLADVGDNGRRRPFCTLYFVEEPPVPAKGAKRRIGSVRPALTVNFKYEDRPHDCEAVAVDPTTRTVYLVTKSPKRTAYELPIPRTPTAKTLVAKRIADLALSYVTAMDMSPDGRRAVVLTYVLAHEYYREGDRTWAEAFSRPPRMILIPARRQGESICYGSDGKTLYLTSERLPTPLLEVPVAESK